MICEATAFSDWSCESATDPAGSFSPSSAAGSPHQTSEPKAARGGATTTKVRNEFYKQQIEAIENPNSTVEELRSALQALPEPDLRSPDGGSGVQAAEARVRVALALRMHEAGHPPLESLAVLENVMTPGSYEARDIVLRVPFGEKIRSGDLGDLPWKPEECHFIRYADNSYRGKWVHDEQIFHVVSDSLLESFEVFSSSGNLVGVWSSRAVT